MSQPSATQVLLHLPDIAEGNRKACVPVARDRVARLVMIFVLLFFGTQGAHAKFDLSHSSWDYSQPLGLTAQTAGELAAGKASIDFLDYDWRLNGPTEARRGVKP